MIREFKTQDSNQILDLCERWSQEVGDGFATFKLEDLIQTFRQIAMSRFHYSMVHEHEGRIIGFAVCQYGANPWNQQIEGTLDWFYVDPKYRHLAQGRDLLSACREWFRQQNCDYYRCFVSAFDQKLQPVSEYLNDQDKMLSRSMTPIGNVYIGACE